ncbi:hypothetical protein J4Q44_G00197080 [Coregonus suidteri]|uniref:TCTP domain-containing protein n=1 Tax=Coregonus suidteri TaxID=861788 RepID=A0AAN8LD82_9TELE
MIIYKDIITGDEMFSDIYKIKESPNGILFEVEGKVRLQCRWSVERRTSMTLCWGRMRRRRCRMTAETSFTKDSYKGYIKDYMKAIKAKLEENNPDRVKPFMTGAQEEIKKIMGNMKNYQFFYR